MSHSHHPNAGGHAHNHRGVTDSAQLALLQNQLKDLDEKDQKYMEA